MKVRLAMLATLAVSALALVETAQALYAPLRTATDGDWQAAAIEVRRQFRDGDLIVFAPSWVDPIGRTHLGDLMPVEMVARADADHYGRIWQLSIRGASTPETSGARLVSTSSHGRVTLSLFEKDAAERGFDFTAHLAEARVTEAPLGDGDEVPCYSDGAAKFRCSSIHVEPRTLEVDYRPRRGILAPVLAGRRVIIEFSDVALGRSLVGYTGLHDYFSRKNGEGPVDLKISIDGEERLRIHHLNTDGWRRFEVATQATVASRHEVRFEISSPQPAWRTFGFHAESRP